MRAGPMDNKHSCSWLECGTLQIASRISYKAAFASAPSHSTAMQLHRSLHARSGVPSWRAAGISCNPPRISVRAAAKRARKTSIKEADDADASDDPKARRLDDIMAALNQRFGKGTIMRLNSSVLERPDVTPSGCLPLDTALGGGYPVGRMIEIFGPESSGKTTLALHAIAEAQKAGRTCVFIDAEHALDKQYAKALGVDVDNMLLVQPDCGEDALEIADQLARTGEFGMVVVDSVSALVPRVELEGEIGQVTVGAQARMMSSAMRKLCGSLNKGRTTLLFLNQIRLKVGVIYGNPEVTSGGNALKFYSSVRVDVRKKETITGEGGNEAVGIKVRAKIVKNKVAGPYREATFDVRFGRGIDELGALFDAAEQCGVLERKGSYYYFASEKLGQGRENVLNVVRENVQLQEKLREAVRPKLEAVEGTPEEGEEDNDGPPPIDDEGAAPAI